MLVGLCTDEINNQKNVSHRVLSLHGSGKEYFFLQLKEHNIDVINLAKSKYNILFILIKLFYYVCRIKSYDVLHFHLRYSTRFGSIIKSIIAADKPSVTSVYEQKHQSPGTYTIFSKLKSRIDIFVALSGLDKRDLISTGIPLEKVELILPHIDIEGANSDYNNTRNALLKQYDIPDDSFIMLCVARLHKDRLLHRIIEILPAVIQNGIKVTLLLVGDGPLKNELSDFAKDIRVENNIKWAGIRYDIWNIFPGSDLYLTFSVDDIVSFAAIQAMACSCPVVAFNIKPMSEKEQLCEYRGYFITTRDKESFSEVVCRFLKNEEMRKEFGRKAQENVNQDKTIKKDSSVLSYIELYEKLVAL